MTGLDKINVQRSRRDFRLAAFFAVLYEQHRVDNRTYLSACFLGYLLGFYQREKSEQFPENAEAGSNNRIILCTKLLCFNRAVTASRSVAVNAAATAVPAVPARAAISVVIVIGHLLFTRFSPYVI